ncbi:ParE toxin of type II toxin-antitoxin system, parDE [uncultured archaeon]|nr:ParE toxin of type II toxin-antitoxin system, parDE [uncultured archaeon]
MYTYEIKEKLAQSLRKIARKDRVLYTEIIKKILQIAKNPAIGKPLRNVLKGKRRIHLGTFVLIYEIHENESKIVFLEIAHHDEAYR